jgi:hypothetical protein
MNYKKLSDISDEIVVHQAELKAIKKYAKILLNQRHLVLNIRLQMELVNLKEPTKDLFCEDVKEQMIIAPIFGFNQYAKVEPVKQNEAVMFSVNYMPPDIALVMFEHIAKHHEYRIKLLEKEYAQLISKSIPTIQKLLNQ